MATVAELLRGAREAAGLTTQQVAELTKMRADRVLAVEEGNYEVFTAPVYIRGFVRTYARLVKADEAAVMATLEAELARTDKFREPPSLVPEQNSALDRLMLRLSRIDWRIALPAALLIMGIAIATWVYRAVERAQNADPLAGIEPATYQPPAEQTAETLPLPPSPR
jgi:cytoskeleton protein RodZ